MSQFYELAHGTKALNYASEFPWPFNIDLCFEPIQYPVAFSEGVGHGAAGCVVTAEEALTGKWRSHFEITGAFWLLPFIQRLANGERLQSQEVLAKYEEIHGSTARRYESRFQ